MSSSVGMTSSVSWIVLVDLNNWWWVRGGWRYVDGVAGVIRGVAEARSVLPIRWTTGVCGVSIGEGNGGDDGGCWVVGKAVMVNEVAGGEGGGGIRTGDGKLVPEGWVENGGRVDVGLSRVGGIRVF